MSKFSFEKIISADRKLAHSILSNYENYQKLLPHHFPSIRIRSVRDNTSVVEEHMNFGGREMIIMAKHVSNEPVLHEIFVIGGDLKGSYFKQQFIEISKKTKIIVDVNLKFKGIMKFSETFRTDKFEKNYREILDDFAKIAET